MAREGASVLPGRPSPSTERLDRDTASRVRNKRAMPRVPQRRSQRGPHAASCRKTRAQPSRLFRSAAARRRDVPRRRQRGEPDNPCLRVDRAGPQDADALPPRTRSGASRAVANISGSGESKPAVHRDNHCARADSAQTPAAKAACLVRPQWVPCTESCPPTFRKAHNPGQRDLRGRPRARRAAAREAYRGAYRSRCPAG